MPAGDPDRAQPRLGLHVVSVLALVVCVLAAWWQWQRAHRTEADAVPLGPVVALADLDPATSFSGMRVGITGRFDPAHEVLVDPRPRDAQDGSWVLTPLLPEDPSSAASGATDAATAVAVVRGWVPRGQRPAPPPGGTVEVVGVLVADSRRPDVQVVPGDPATVAMVDTGALAQYAGYPVRSGWFALSQMSPAGTGQPLPLQVTELPGADVGLNWRNAAYAVQWIVFAAFVVVFWNRFRRDHVDRPVEQESTS
jgi:cytochrome oxidase assembly protein ShyY1